MFFMQLRGSGYNPVFGRKEDIRGRMNLREGSLYKIKTFENAQFCSSSNKLKLGKSGRFAKVSNIPCFSD